MADYADVLVYMLTRICMDTRIIQQLYIHIIVLVVFCYSLALILNICVIIFQGIGAVLERRGTVGTENFAPWP